MRGELRLVPPEPTPEPSLAYEWRERQRIREKDWAAVHIAADRRRPLHIPDRIARLWR